MSQPEPYQISARGCAGILLVLLLALVVGLSLAFIVTHVPAIYSAAERALDGVGR